MLALDAAINGEKIHFTLIFIFFEKIEDWIQSEDDE